MAVIPQFSLNTNNPSEWGRVEAGAGTRDKRRVVVLTAQTTGAGATEIFIDGVTNYRLKLFENSIITVQIVGASLAPTAAGSAGFTGAATASNIAGTVALVGAAVVTKVGNATAALAVTADDTNDALVFTVTPSAAVTTNWEIQLYITEVTDIQT